MSTEVVAKYKLLFKDLASKGLLKVSTNAAKMQNSLKKAAKGIAGLGVITGGALALLGNQHLDMAQDIKNFSQIANANVEDFQKMAVAAKGYGIETDKLADQLKDVTERVGDYRLGEGGPMADFFDKMKGHSDISIADFDGLSSIETLQKYYDEIEKSGLDQADKTLLLENMAGDLTNLIPILKNGGAEIKRLGDIAKASGAILTELDIKNAEELNEDLKILGLQFDGIKASVMRALMPALKSVSGWFIDNKNTISAFITKSIELAGVIGGKLVAGFKIIKPYLSIFADKLGDMFGFISDNKDVLISLGVGIAGVIAVLGGISVAGAAVGIITSIVSALSALTGLLSVVSSIGGISGVFSVLMSMAKVLPVIGPAIAAIASPIGIAVLVIGSLIAAGVWLYRNWELVKSKASEIFNSLPAPIQEMGRNIVEVFELIKSIALPVFEIIKNLVILNFEIIKNTVITVFQLIVGVMQTNLAIAQAIVGTALTIIATLFNTGFELIKNIFVTSWQVIKAIFTGNWQAIPSIIQAGMGRAWAIIKTGISSILGSFAGLAGKLLVIGGQAIQGLINGIKSKVSAAVSAAKNLASSVSNAVKNFFTIRSPSRLFASFGEFLSLGLAGGISAKAGAAIAQANRLASGVANAASGIGSTLMGDLGRDAKIAAEAKSDLMMTHRFEFDISGQIAGAQAQVNTTYKSNGNNAGSNMPVML